LIYAAIPIFVDGEHVVNLFAGQFFLEPPDIDYFRRQAAYYGYDVENYLDALNEVAVLDEKTVEQGSLFLSDLAELIALMAFEEKELLDFRDELELRVKIRTIELKKAFAEIKTLRGILPLCSFCKKIRDENGYWEQADAYIDKHSQADISHSVCPECMRKHYPEAYASICTDKK